MASSTKFTNIRRDIKATRLTKLRAKKAQKALLKLKKAGFNNKIEL